MKAVVDVTNTAVLTANDHLRAGGFVDYDNTGLSRLVKIIPPEQWIRTAASGYQQAPLWVGKRPLAETKWASFFKENSMKTHLNEVTSPVPWNKGRLIGQKAPLKRKET